MSRRKFEFRTLNEESVPVLDIPSWMMLGVSRISDLARDFRTAYDVSPSYVALPCLSELGPIFPVDGIAEYVTSLPFVGNHVEFESVLEEISALSPRPRLIFTLSPPQKCFPYDQLHKVTIDGSGTPELCIGNPMNQQMLGAILGTAIDLAREVDPDFVFAVAVDCVDLWGMGGENDRIKLTCFCNYCSNYFESHEPGILQDFKTFPNPWNLGLKINESGVGYIDQFTAISTPAEVVSLSRLKGFDSAFGGASEGELLESASSLLRYMNLRHNQAVESVDAIFQIATSGLEGIERHMIVEGAPYDWTGGLMLERLSEVRWLSGIWMNDAGSISWSGSADLYAYMWRRSRYFLDNFFSYVYSACDPIQRNTTQLGRLSIDEMRSSLRDRGAKASSSKVEGATALNLNAIGRPDFKPIGFVGVPLTDKVVTDIARLCNVAPGPADSGSVGGIDPRELIQQLLRNQGFEDA